MKITLSPATRAAITDYLEKNEARRNKNMEKKKAMARSRSRNSGSPLTRWKDK